jgi:hypothetical protein
MPFRHLSSLHYVFIFLYNRELYLMAVTFPDKQKWVASFEAAIKSLQRVDATFKRTVSSDYGCN